MFLKDAAIVLLVAVFVSGESLSDLSAKYASKPYPQTSRVYSSYAYPTGSNRQKEDHSRYSTVSDVSPYTSRPVYSSRVQTNDDQYGYSTTGQESWIPWNGSYVRRDICTRSRRPPTRPYYTKGKIVKTSEKPKQKKPQFLYYSNPYGSKKTMYPRVHTPYTMHKYPTKKTVHPYYRRYYQTQFAMPSTDMLRNKVKNIYSEADESATSAPSGSTDRLYNTEDYSMSSEEYTGYNDTHPSRSSYSTSYENYDEMDQTTAEPTSYDESSTRGYYGDRIYMSTQVPAHGAEKGARHRYYIVRSEPEEDEDDLETIFD
ncbi:UNVERIFIED_CONTAM: hypothetical protein PYX00_003913 [Menopon gallinae]|uniref:Adhesive plaque matrix protein-like n=1 Tax=Menopon gallinae TaxID=328185 RepID=A0AAW2I1U1_9NEOP